MVATLGPLMSDRQDRPGGPIGAFVAARGIEDAVQGLRVLQDDLTGTRTYDDWKGGYGIGKYDAASYIQAAIWEIESLRSRVSQEETDKQRLWSLEDRWQQARFHLRKLRYLTAARDALRAMDYDWEGNELPPVVPETNGARNPLTSTNGEPE